MKKTLTISSLIAAIGMTLAVPAQADVKIGLVDMNKIFSSYYKTKDAEGKINNARAAAKTELDERMESYKHNIDAINKLNDELSKPELSKDAKAKKGKERDEKINSTKELEREITEFRASREKDLQAQALRMRDGIVKEITALIQERVKKDQYDLVLDKSGNSINGVPVVLFSKESSDFSDEIIETLNKDKPAESASTPAADAKADDKKK
ncbi:MAG TPA: OmpH family outer membrane protein [Chthoniobacteraceae bacterium]|nr:OmpH family outer membrane protein [Chthoniobacteraceae bacterium]